MKNTMRNKMITKIQQMDVDEKKSIAQSLCLQLTQSKVWKRSSIIGITYATTLEWDTTDIMEIGWLEGKKIALPKVNNREKTMDFFAIQHLNELSAGYANILEPQPLEGEKNVNQEIDLLIVPGLMFDYNGYRLGFGGGFYDRYLANSEHETTTLSIVAMFQLVENLPVDHYDIPIDYIITEHSCIKTTSRGKMS